MRTTSQNIFGLVKVRSVELDEVCIQVGGDFRVIKKRKKVKT